MAGASNESESNLTGLYQLLLHALEANTINRIVILRPQLDELIQVNAEIESAPYILPAGRSALVELPISAAPSVEQFRTEFNITFDDQEREGKTLAFADMVQLLRPAAEFQPVPNPYAPGTPLAPSSPIFFGCDDLFQFISENIAGLTRQNILVLIGQRRMGKTSFLQQLPARLGDDYLPVYIDGQSLGIDPGMANFFYDLSLAIVDALADQRLGASWPVAETCLWEQLPALTYLIRLIHKHFPKMEI